MKKTFLKAFTAVIAVLALSLNVFAAGSIVGSIDMPNASSDRGKVTLSAVDLSKYSEELQQIIGSSEQCQTRYYCKRCFWRCSSKSDQSLWTEQHYQKGHRPWAVQIPFSGHGYYF